jgi:hypothetical protein
MGCIKEDLEFKDGIPVAACVIHNCLLRWHAFESDSSEIIDLITDTINHEVMVILVCSLISNFLFLFLFLFFKDKHTEMTVCFVGGCCYHILVMECYLAILVI